MLLSVLWLLLLVTVVQDGRLRLSLGAFMANILMQRWQTENFPRGPTSFVRA